MAIWSCNLGGPTLLRFLTTSCRIPWKAGDLFQLERNQSLHFSASTFWSVNHELLLVESFSIGAYSQIATLNSMDDLTERIRGAFQVPEIWMCRMLNFCYRIDNKCIFFLLRKHRNTILDSQWLFHDLPSVKNSFYSKFTPTLRKWLYYARYSRHGAISMIVPSKMRTI